MIPPFDWVMAGLVVLEPVSVVVVEDVVVVQICLLPIGVREGRY